MGLADQLPLKSLQDRPALIRLPWVAGHLGRIVRLVG
jgi:hypothetical protein